MADNRIQTVGVIFQNTVFKLVKNNYGDESDLIWSVFLTMINMGNDCAEVENKQREKCSKYYPFETGGLPSSSRY